MATPADALARLLEILDRVEIPYFVGGSVASSAHGVPRATMDVDLVADLKSDQVDEFVALLGKDFYAAPHVIKEALARGQSFNLIHFATAYKFDLFPLRADAYSRVEFARRTFIELILSPLNAPSPRPRIRSCASSNGIARLAKPPSASGAISAASST